MAEVVGLFNGALTGLFNLLFRPFYPLDPIWAMLVVSLLTGVLMLWIFGKLSNQQAIRREKDQIRGNIIAIRLYRDDLGLLFRLQGRILRRTLSYMRYSLIPLLVILPPVLLIIIQLALRYEARPLEPGERALVEVQLNDSEVLNQVSLDVPDGVVVETPGVRVSSLGEITWRIRVDEPGRHRLRVSAGEDETEKDLVVGGRWAAVSQKRTAGLLDSLLHPGEPPLAGALDISRVEVNYPRQSVGLFGWNIHWLVLFFVFSIVFGFAFKGLLGVEI